MKSLRATAAIILFPKGKHWKPLKATWPDLNSNAPGSCSSTPKKKITPRQWLTGLAEITLTIAQRVGESDRLYGSVTNVHIAEALAKQGFEIDRKKIDMPEPIKTAGAHEAVVKLHTDVKAVIKIEVVSESA